MRERLARHLHLNAMHASALAGSGCPTSSPWAKLGKAGQAIRRTQADTLLRVILGPDQGVGAPTAAACPECGCPSLDDVPAPGAYTQRMEFMLAENERLRGSVMRLALLADSAHAPELAEAYTADYAYLRAEAASGVDYARLLGQAMIAAELLIPLAHLGAGVGSGAQRAAYREALGILRDSAPFDVPDAT